MEEVVGEKILLPIELAVGFLAAMWQRAAAARGLLGALGSTGSFQTYPGTDVPCTSCGRRRLKTYLGRHPTPPSPQLYHYQSVLDNKSE